MKAMVFAAGLGTRLRPLTDMKPKALVELNGKPLLAITLDKLIDAGFDEIIVNVHHFSEQVVDFLARYKSKARIQISDESKLLLDTGGGLKKAAWFFDDGKPFLVHNVDIVSHINIKELYHAHLSNGTSIATLAINHREASRVFLVNKTNEIAGWKNLKTNETRLSRDIQQVVGQVSFCGVHVIHPDIFPLITETGVFSIVDVYLRLAKSLSIATYDTKQVSWFDLGTPESLAKAGELF
jgi:NDP-sugar pyrophosphorylase family protein